MVAATISIIGASPIPAEMRDPLDDQRDSHLGYGTVILFASQHQQLPMLLAQSTMSVLHFIDHPDLLHGAGARQQGHMA